MNLRRTLLASSALLVATMPAGRADVAITAGSGTTVFDFTCFTSKHCMTSVPINSSGTEIFTTGAPGAVNVGQVGGTTTDTNSGSKSAGTQRVVIATDQPQLTNPTLAIGTGTAGTAATGVLTVQGIASMTKLLVTPDANSAVNVAQVAGTTTDTNSGSKSAGTQRVVIATDQPALTNAQPSNLTQIGGTTVDTNSGSKSAGTQRVVIATDQPSLTNGLTVAGGGTAGSAASGVVTVQGIASMTKLLVTPDANSAVNVAQLAGTTVDTNSGTKSAGTLRTVIATDQPALTNAQPGDFTKLLGQAVVASATGIQKVGISGNAAATLDAAIGAATAPTNMLAVGGVYNSTPLTLSNGQSSAAQLDSKGRLIGVIYDAAANARGANVTASNALVVDGSGVTQPISGGLSDGTNTAKVLAASTQAAATDKSLVVQINPNQPQITSTPQGDFIKINGTTVLAGNGATGTGSQRVTLANDSTAIAGWGHGATGSAPPSGAQYLGANGSGATGGLMRGLITCDSHAKYDASDNGSITLVTGVSGRKVYICGYILATGGTATNLKLREGSDANCASNAADLTPAWQLVANDKIGAASAFWTGLVVSTNAYYVCVNASAGNAHQAEIWYSII